MEKEDEICVRGLYLMGLNGKRRQVLLSLLINFSQENWNWDIFTGEKGEILCLKESQEYFTL